MLYLSAVTNYLLNHDPTLQKRMKTWKSDMAIFSLSELKGELLSGYLSFYHDQDGWVRPSISKISSVPCCPSGCVGNCYFIRYKKSPEVKLYFKGEEISFWAPKASDKPWSLVSVYYNANADKKSFFIHEVFSRQAQWLPEEFCDNLNVLSLKILYLVTYQLSRDC